MSDKVMFGEERREQHWTLDKRVPIALIFVLCGQLFGFGWFLAKNASDVAANTIEIENTNEYVLTNVIALKQSHATKEWAIGEHKVIETKIANTNKDIESIQKSMSRMENKIDKMYDLILLNKRVNDHKKD